MQSGEQFEVRHEALDSAAGALPEQVSALGSQRQVVTSRQVPAEAFGNVDASEATGARHAGVVAETDRGLGVAADRLGEIIRRIRETTTEFRDWDDAKAGEQRADTQQLAQAGPPPPVGPSPTVQLPYGQPPFQTQPGQDYIVPLGTSIFIDGVRITPDEVRPDFFLQPDNSRIKWVNPEDVPQS